MQFSRSSLLMTLGTLLTFAPAGAAQEVWGRAVMPQPFDAGPFREVRVPAWVRETLGCGYTLSGMDAAARAKAAKHGVTISELGFVDPFYVFSVDLSVRFALGAIIGGMGTALGPFLGALLITTLETYLRAQFGGIGAGLVGIYLIIYGSALILVVRFVPQGLVGWLADRLPRLRAAGAGA